MEYSIIIVKTPIIGKGIGHIKITRFRKKGLKNSMILNYFWTQIIIWPKVTISIKKSEFKSVSFNLNAWLRNFYDIIKTVWKKVLKFHNFYNTLFRGVFVE